MTIFTIYLLISGIGFPISLIYVVKWFKFQLKLKRQVEDCINYIERSDDNASGNI